MSFDQKDNKLKELHNNIRHITQLGMSWFAFFATSNYLTMGWLAKPSAESSESITQAFIWIVPSVFILQNILGILGLIWVLKEARAMKMQVISLENSKNNEESSTSESIPSSLYNLIGGFLISVLMFFTGAWAYTLLDRFR